MRSPMAGTHEHALGEGVDQALALEHGNEAHRTDPVAVMAPARERFDADDVPCLDLDLGLEERLEFIVAQTFAQGIEADLDIRFGHEGIFDLVVGAERFRELGGGQRFFDYAEHAQTVGPRHALYGVEQRGIERAGERDRARELARGDMTDEFDTVHFRQVEIDQHDVMWRRGLLEGGQSRLPVIGFAQTREPEFLEQAQCHAALKVVVFHDHDR